MVYHDHREVMEIQMILKEYDRYRKYEYMYENCVCVGEMIRNICVNLGIDPDTIDGVTRNVQVWKIDWNGQGECRLWNYNPFDSIGDHSRHGQIHILLQGK